MKQMSNYEDLEKKVLDWAEEKGILAAGNPVAQCRKTLEEVHELMEAVDAQYNEHDVYLNSKGEYVQTHAELQDALGDILVTIIIGAKLQKLNLVDCLDSAYKVISKRTGKMVDGMFVKDKK